MSFEDLSYEALGGVSIYISEAYGYAGNLFDENDEKAFVSVEVRNNTGLTLRDVVVSIQASGAIMIYPMNWMHGIVLVDGEESWDEIEPYETKSFKVRLKGRYSGNGYLNAYISAEIVPYSSRERTSRTIMVHPS